ncbi:PTS transporter subunit EIIB [Staphylococcus saprophyticus]|uniref:PTS transporter subunit EIIB n=1 Tax=Staphylococcus saprophyticus TaxID=29385 RepID=UPI0034DD81CE
MNYDNLGKEIIDLVGGENNISSLEHCECLRFVLKDTDQADNSKINELPKVLQVVEQGGQFQIVIGNDVANVYDVIVKN